MLGRGGTNGSLKYSELKSYQSSTINNIPSSTQFKEQLAAYFTDISSLNELRYSFDSKKLIDDFPPTEAQINAALEPIKDKFRTLLGNSDNFELFTSNMNETLSGVDILNIQTEATMFTNTQINLIVNAIVTIE